MTTLEIQNTLGNVKERFIPVDPSNIRIYACGPTVYDYAHIGNARMAVVNDLLVRLLRKLYPKVTYVSNITDIDDKIIQTAQNTNTPFIEMTRKFEKIYNEDMFALGVLLPDIQPRATEHIKDMIELIKKLIETHNTNNTVATVTAINTPSRFGVMDIDKTTNQIRSFHEKPSLNSVRVNGGFFVLSNPVFDYLEKHENSIFEKEPLEELVRNNELSAYCHNGFWHSMDTLRDKLHLDAIWEAGKAPWALWET